MRGHSCIVFSFARLRDTEIARKRLPRRIERQFRGRVTQVTERPDHAPNDGSVGGCEGWRERIRSLRSTESEGLSVSVDIVDVTISRVTRS